MIHTVVPVARVLALLPSAEELLSRAQESPAISIPLGLTAFALAGLFLVWLRRLPHNLRARKSPSLDPIQLEELMLGNPPQIIDLREHRAFKSTRGHIRGSMNIPYGELASRIHELDTSHPRPIVLVDETDVLSHKALPVVASQGHPWIYVLKGGFQAWRQRKMPVYQSHEPRKKA